MGKGAGEEKFWFLMVLEEKSGRMTESVRKSSRRLCISQTVVAFFVIWIATQAGDDRDFILVLHSELLYKMVLVLHVYPSKIYAFVSQPSDVTQR
jgi:hypothetical protein